VVNILTGKIGSRFAHGSDVARVMAGLDRIILDQIG